jgi:general stress protein 26
MDITKEVMDSILKQVDSTREVVVCSMDEAGFPNAKAMFLRKHEGLHTFWFSTNVSAARTMRFQENPKACLYFLDADAIHGLMLTGEMKVFMDEETKQDFWEPSDIMYYQQGPTDPDYCMMCFTAGKGNYWGSGKYEFDVTSL